MGSAAARVLVVDRDLGLAEAVCRMLAPAGLVGRAAATTDAALGVLESTSVEVVVIDSSLDLPALLRARFPEVPWIVVAHGGSTAEATSALESGATEVLEGPLDAEQLVFSVKKALARVDRASAESGSVQLRGAILGESEAMRRAFDVARRAAAGTATVLVRGESGTGKELVARAIHDLSPRRAGPFVKIDCTSLPENLLESELFGYEKGAFTGAGARKLGRVELADGGTLFLDEIGELTLPLQAKLLRLLQDRAFERLGGTRTLEVDLRVVAATHRDLDAMLVERQLRQDLYYRLNVVPVWLPPLRARRDDVPVLARHFCAAFAEANGKPRARLDDSALRVLRAQRWPGNVRQLQNFIERLVVLADSDVVTGSDVTDELSRHVPFATEAGSAAGSVASLRSSAGLSTGSVPTASSPTLEATLRAAERGALLGALAKAQNNRRLAARVLGISRSNLYLKLAEHGIE